MTFPTAGQRHIGLGDLFRHHPQSENVAAIRTKPQSAVFSGNYGRVQSGAKKIVKVFGGKSRSEIVLSRSRRELLSCQRAHAMDQVLPIAFEFQVCRHVVIDSYHLSLNH